MINLTWFVAIFCLSACVLVKIYLKLTTGWCKCRESLEGKTVLVTGATSGIGYETALDFARRGARVILTSKTLDEGDETKTKIVTETGNENISVKLLDLASFSSVRNFAREIYKSEERLDILINNAGVYRSDRERTRDDCLSVMQINYFSPFLLTNLLTGLMKKTGGRIINISSLVAKHYHDLCVNKLNDSSIFDHKIYGRSKLCLVLFTSELAQRLKGTGITTYSVHPGVVRTNIFNNVNGLGKIIIWLGTLFFKTSREGAQTTIHCAVSEETPEYNGEHFEDCKMVEKYATARDKKQCKELWEVTAKIVKLDHLE